MFEGITEAPGNMASKQQLQILLTRYQWARSIAKDKKILEIACGSGIALKALSESLTGRA